MSYSRASAFLLPPPTHGTAHGTHGSYCTAATFPLKHRVVFHRPPHHPRHHHHRPLCAQAAECSPGLVREMLSWSYYAVSFLLVTLFQALLPEMYVSFVENGFSALVDGFKGATFLILGFVTFPLSSPSIRRDGCGWSDAAGRRGDAAGQAAEDRRVRGLLSPLPRARGIHTLRVSSKAV